MICTLTGCDHGMAKDVFEQTNDVTLAVDKILFKTEIPPKKKPTMDEAQEELEKIRETMKEFDKKMDARPDSTINQFSISLSRRARAGLISTLGHHEETVLQNNCSLEYQLPSLQSEEQKQETACPSPSVSTSCLPSNDRTSHDSGPQYRRSSLDQEKE